MGVPFNPPDPTSARNPPSPPSTSSSEDDPEVEHESETDSDPDDEQAVTATEQLSRAALELLIASSADDEWEDPSSNGTLGFIFRAAETGSSSELRQLLAQLDVSIDTTGPDGDTALHLAALYGHYECAQILIEAGATADIPDDNGGVPVHDAAAGGYSELVELLLDRAPNSVNVQDHDGDTPLHNAARGGHTGVVRLLLARGADPTVQNHDWQTPYRLSVAGSDCRIILERAEVDWEDDDDDDVTEGEEE